ncbi:MAG TPA: hypothetical protein VIL28_13835, partial [Steroidobacteraceae bacterium]
MSNTNSITQHASDARRGRSSGEAAAVHRCDRRSSARRHTSVAALALALLAIACGQNVAQAEGREQAKRMFDRLTGTPPSPQVLNDLETA